MPPERVGEAGVEDGVGAAPRVRQQDHKLKSSSEGQEQAVLMQAPEIEGVKRQPAHPKHNYHRHHHFGDLTLQPVALSGGRRGPEPLAPQGEQQRGVGGRHDGERQSEAHDEGVGQNAEPPGLGDKLRHTLALIGRKVKSHGKNGEERKEPQQRRDDLGAARRSPARESGRVSQRHVTVDAHYRQTEDTGELVYPVQHHDRFARRVAKHPVVLEVLARYEGKTNHEESVGQSQVEYVDRCRR